MKRRKMAPMIGGMVQATMNSRGGHKTWHSFGSPDPGEAVYSYSDFVPVSETFVNCQILPSSPRL